jgi:hypothetical protein
MMASLTVAPTGAHRVREVVGAGYWRRLAWTEHEPQWVEIARAEGSPRAVFACRAHQLCYRIHVGVL